MPQTKSKDMWTVAKMTQVAKHPEGAEGPHFFKNVSNSEKGIQSL